MKVADERQFEKFMTQEVAEEHEKRKGHANSYAVLIFVAVAWMWHVKFSASALTLPKQLDLILVP